MIQALLPLQKWWSNTEITFGGPFNRNPDTGKETPKINNSFRKSNLSKLQKITHFYIKQLNENVGTNYDFNIDGEAVQLKQGRLNSSIRKLEVKILLKRKQLYFSLVCRFSLW